MMCGRANLVIGNYRSWEKNGNLQKNLERSKEIRTEKTKQERMTPKKGELEKIGTPRTVLFLGREDVISLFVYPKYVSR